MCRNQEKKLNKQLYIMINGDHCFEGKKQDIEFLLFSVLMIL